MATDHIIPSRLAVHFEAAKSAKLLTINTMAPAGGDWLVLRLLADWMRQVEATAEDNGRCLSGVGFVVFSLKHDFDYYAEHMAHYGIDLRRLEDQGHVFLLGNVFTRLFGDRTTSPPTPPSLTLLASMQLLAEVAGRLQARHERTALLIDSPEYALPLLADSPDRIQQWVLFVHGAAFQYHSAMISMVLRMPNMQEPDPRSFAASVDAIKGVESMSQSSDMDMTLQPASPGNTHDGTVRIEYQQLYEPPRSDLAYASEEVVYRLRPDCRGVDVTDTF